MTTLRPGPRRAWRGHGQPKHLLRVIAWTVATATGLAGATGVAVALDSRPGGYVVAEAAAGWGGRDAADRALPVVRRPMVNREGSAGRALLPPRPTTPGAAPAPPPPLTTPPPTAASAAPTSAVPVTPPASPTTALPAAPTTTAAPPTTVAATSPPPPETVTTPASPGSVDQQVLDLVNAARAAAGCGDLAFNAALTAAADGHAQDMKAQGYFSHTSLDGRSPFDRMRAAGYTYSTAGENIAQGQADAAAVMTAWMNSPGHQANIVNCAFRELGVGHEEGSGGPWWVQNFGG